MSSKAQLIDIHYDDWSIKHPFHPIKSLAGERQLYFCQSLGAFCMCGMVGFIGSQLVFSFLSSFSSSFLYCFPILRRLDDASDISIQPFLSYVVKIPLRLLSTLASFLLRRPPPERSSALDTTEEPRQHSTITFRSSLTLNGFHTGKKCGSEASDVATTSSHDDDSLTQILSEWHQATPQFDPESKMTLDDFELLETLGAYLGWLSNKLFGRCWLCYYLRYRYIWSRASCQTKGTKHVLLCNQSVKEGWDCSFKANWAYQQWTRGTFSSQFSLHCSIVGSLYNQPCIVSINISSL